MISPELTVWPHWLVPPPRAVTGTPSSRAIAKRRDRPVHAAGHNHPGRHHLIMGCVGRIAPPRKRIEQHIPGHMGLQTAFQPGLHDLDHGKRAMLSGYFSGLFACSGLKAMPDIASVSGGTAMAQGQHFLQIPGPSPVPERIQRAIDRQVIDHRGPEFQKLGQQVLADIRPIFGTTQPVIIYPASGTGAWEAAIVNTLSPGDHVLMAETGQFATLWRAAGGALGHRGRFPARRLAPWRGCGRHRSQARGRQVAHHQGGDGGAQRNLHRLPVRHRRRAQGDGCGQAPRPADGGHDFLAGFGAGAP